ncbi:M48 family peptidase [Puteibacter caeruleilacunae]|nr:M48 family peptidase [Puteibacter caeruleilacunae]
MSDYFIQYGNTRISYSLTFADRKTLGIRVYPDKSVHVIAPVDTPQEIISNKVHSKAAWIVKQQDFFLAFHPFTPPRRFVSGETHRYLGKQYRLKLIDAKYEGVKLHGGNIVVYIKDRSDKARIEKLMKAWYRSKADIHLKRLFEENLSWVKGLHVGTPTLKLRWMNKRWGSCNKSGAIQLNLELIKASKKCIEYVIIHELCHLVHLNHSTAFYDLLDKYSPDWRRIKDELEKMMV